MHADQLQPELDKDAPGVACAGLLSVGDKPDHGMSFGLFMATEGGRKCPLCGKYAKRSELGNLSFKTEFRQGWAHITMYGHLPGYGCNLSDNVKATRGCKPLSPPSCSDVSSGLKAIRKRRTYSSCGSNDTPREQS